MKALNVAMGYPELVAHLQGRMTYEEALSQIRINHHQYARKQMTWFRGKPVIHWLMVEQLTPEGVHERALERVLSATGA